MAKVYPVEIKIIAQTGKKDCLQGHRIGDTWIARGKTPEPPVCVTAYYVMFHKIYAMRLGAEFPMGKDPDTITATCPDTETSLVFQIKRLPPDK